jgi:membrane-bound serine protease (ClpP class)
VRESASITEYEALDMNVINYIAKDMNELLDKIDGDTVDVVSGKFVLHTKGAEVKDIKTSFSDKLLGVISNPNIAYILLTLGMMGLYFEFSNPGAIVPGIVGGICLIMAFFAMQTLPINYAGLALMILAVILFILELKITSHGVLAIGGTVSLFLGSLMLIDSDVPYMRVSLAVIIPTVIITAAFFLFAIYFALEAQKRRVVTGEAGIIGEIGEVKEMADGHGIVFVHGEFWKAEAAGDLPVGTKVKIVAVDGMKLKVEKI